jgi:PAS domain S-box-containing protein
MSPSRPDQPAPLGTVLAALALPEGRTLLDALHEGITVYGRDGALLVHNPAALRLLRIDPDKLRDRGLFESSWNVVHEDGTRFDPADFPASVCLRTGRPSDPTVLGVVHPDGEVTWFRVHAHPLGSTHGAPDAVVVAFVDVTMQKRMEPRLLETGRMEAVGRLASRVAHDFNNALTAITGYTEMLLASVDAGHPMVPDLEQIRLAGERAAVLTRQMLELARGGGGPPRPLDLDAVLGRMERHLRRVVGDGTTLEFVPGSGGAWILGDPSRLTQIAIGLAMNAREALPEGGAVAFETRTRDAGPVAELAAEAPARAGTGNESPGNPGEGRWVSLEVRDNGVGMDERTLRHAFDPFFTTKAPGRGSGLGLTVVRALMLEMGGRVTLRSAPGRGATITLWWPAIEPPAAPDAVPDAQSVLGTVLVVEDEDPVRAVVSGALRGAGFRVIEARGGAEAIEAARDEPADIDLLLTDVLMPEMRGTELAERLSRERPGIRVLFISGYPDVDGLAATAAPEFLIKPFTSVALLERVRRVLGVPAAR